MNQKLNLGKVPIIGQQPQNALNLVEVVKMFKEMNESLKEIKQILNTEFVEKKSAFVEREGIEL